MGGGGISQVWGGHQSSMGGVISQVWGGAISQVWGGHQPSMGGIINQLWGGGHQPSMGGSSTNYGGAISQVWGGIFPPVCTGSQNPENYFSNTYVLPSVNRTAGPINHKCNQCNHLDMNSEAFLQYRASTH